MRKTYIISLILYFSFPFITWSQDVDIETLVPTACYNFIDDFENDNGLTNCSDPGADTQNCIEPLEPTGGTGEFLLDSALCFGNNQWYQMQPGQSLDVPESSLPDSSESNYTVELLFRIDSIPPSNTEGAVYIMNFSNQSGKNVLIINEEGYICLDPNSGNSAPTCGTTKVSPNYPNDVPTGFLNIAFSFDGDQMTVYFNGETQFSVTATGGNNDYGLRNNTEFFRPSSAYNVYDDPIAGITVDYIRYFSGILDATAIESLNLAGTLADDIDLIASDTTGCIGDMITLSATGGARSYYIWSTGDTTATENLNYTIFQETDTVWVIGVGVSPCDRRCFDIADTIVISGFPLPELGIVGPTDVCEDESVTFSSAADPAGIATYAWATTGPTSTSSGANTKDYSVTYSTEGIYTITLALVNEFGCAGDTTFQITVKNVPTTTVTAPATACEGETVNIVYTGDAGPNANFNWDFDGGTIISENVPGRDFDVLWDSLGTKSIYFEIDENNCLVSGLATIEILKRPTLSLTAPEILCAQEIAEITYTGNADPTAVFTWNFDGGVNTGDDINALVEWAEAGTKNITLQIGQNGCVRDTSFSLTVLPIPTTDLTAPFNVCSGLPINIEYTGTANADAELVWNLDGGTVVTTTVTDRNFDVQWTTLGTKNITLTIAQEGCDTDTTFQVVVGKTPTANFNLPTGACMDEPVRVLYTGTANLALNAPDLVFDWNFDDGVATDISTSQEAYDVEWSTAGVKTVSLQVTENGCISTIFTRDIEIFLKPIIDFDPVFPAIICLDDVVTVNFIGDAGVAGVFNWNFGDATQVNVTNANTQFDLQWSTTGVKNFSLEINNNGCITEEFFTVEVFTPPTTDLIFDPFACEGKFTRIIYAGTGNTDPAAGTVYNWDFAGADEVVDLGDQAYDVRWNTFDEVTPANNIKNISLEIIENGCVIIRDFTIELTQTPIPQINAPTEICVDQPATVEFSSDLPAATFTFNVGTGVSSATANPDIWEVTWATPGIKTISVTYSLNGCDSTISQQIEALSVPSDAMDDIDEICDNETAVFTYVGDGNPITNITWTMPAGVTFTDLSGDDQSIEITFPATGATEIYTIEALIENGICNILYSNDITVYPAADATIPTPNPVCSSDPIVFDLSAYFVPGASYSWNWDGGVVTNNSGTGIWTVHYETPGTKNIQLTVRTPAGCLDTDNLSLNVGFTPEMVLTVPAEVCDGDNFTITYDGDLTGVTSLTWIDDDGGNFTFNGTNAWTGNYATQGVKTVSFRAEGGAGCVVDTTFNIVVNSIPDFDLSSDNTCSGITVFVTFKGAFSPGVDTTWTFIDQVTLEEGISRKLTDSTYSVEFPTPGTKDIILDMTGGGCGDQTLTKQVEVIQGPEYTVDSNDEVCLDEQLGISINQEPGTDVEILNVELLPGDDGSFVSITPDGLFALIGGWNVGGTKQAVLEIRDISGACAIQYDTVNYIVYNYVEFEISSDNVCIGESVNLRLTSLTRTGSTFNWDFGGANVTTITENEEYQLSWNTSGSKIVRLEIESVCGLEVGEIEINVGEPADLSLDFEPAACLGEAVPIIYDMNLLLASAVSSVEIKYLDIPFDTSNDDPANGTFAPVWNTIGIKDFRLIVNNGGCIDSIDHQITIYEIPVASFTRSDNRVCVGEPVTFNFNGTAPQSTVFDWDFQEDAVGDITENTVNTSYEVVWQTPGNKIVTLILNNQGCTDTLSRTIIVDPFPNFALNLPTEICANAPFQLSLDNNGTGTIADFQFNWNFDDATVVNLGSQTYELTYPTDGPRTISVNISSIAGCNNSLSEGIIVNPSPNIVYDASTSVLCVGDVFNFRYTGVVGTDYTGTVLIQWDELDGGLETAVSNIESNITWTTPGIKNIRVIINDDLACNAVLDLQVNVLDAPTEDMDYPTEACINEEFIVRYTGSANQTSDDFTWNFSDAANLTAVKIAGQQAYRLTYTTLGTKRIDIEITNASGCTTNFFIEVALNAGPDFAVNLSDVCTLDDLLFYVGTETVVNINPGQDGIWDPANPNVVSWTTAGLKTIALTLDNGSCVVTRNFQVSVFATPGGEIMITEACVGQPVLIEYGGLGAASIFADFDWGTSFDDAISVVKLAGTEAYEVTWDTEGVYNIAVEVTENGCTNTIALPSIDIRGVPEGNFNLPATICEFEELILSVQNPDTNYTYAWDLGADGIIVNSNANSTQITALWENRGDKIVSLITSLNDCEQVTQKTIRVLNAPDPSFDAPFFCFDEITNQAVGTITYTGDNNLTTSTFNWDFDLDAAAGETATQIAGTQNYDVVYTTPGRKIVSLEVTNANCGSRIFIDTVYVNNLAEFSLESANDDLCEGATATIVFTGTAEENAVFIWDFAIDPAVDVVTEIVEDSLYQVTYNSTGTKTITLNIIGVNCNDSEFEYIFQVAAKPISDFTLSAIDNCLGDLTTINFTGSATTNANWIWNFADGTATPLGNQNYEVRWPTPGEKVISLVIEDGGCLSDTTYQTINVYDNSALQLMIDTNLCIDDVGTVTVNTEFFEPNATWSWRFNDANIISSNADSTEINFSFPTEGQRNIRFLVNGDVCEDRDTTAIVNVGSPIPFAISADTKVCLGDSSRIVFNLPIVNGRTLTWDFDNPSRVNKVSNSREDYYVIWNTVGIKNIQVSINNKGCIRDSSFQVEVTALPVASYIADGHYCEGDILSLYPEGNITAQTIVGWSYNYNGNVGSSTNPNLQLLLTEAGTVELTLRILERGCQDFFTNTIEVRETPEAAIDAPGVICLEDLATVRFDGALLPGLTYEWFFDNANTVNNLGNETYELGWEIGGDKTIWTISYLNGCPSDTAFQTLNVFSVDNLEISSDTICQHQTLIVSFIEESVETIGYTWDFDGAEIISGSGLGPYELLWADAGEKSVTLNINGVVCNSDQFTKTALVEPTVFPMVNISIPDLVCLNIDISPVLTVTSEGDNPEFAWFINGRYAGVTFDSTLIQNNDTIQVRMTSDHPCAINNRVFSNEVVAQIVDYQYTGNTYAMPVPICIGDTASVYLDEGEYIILDWEMSENLSDWESLNDNSEVLRVAPVSNTYYRAVISDLQEVCVQTTPAAEVEVVPYNQIEAGPDVTVRQGDFRILEATRGTSFIWRDHSSIEGDTRNSRVRVRPSVTTTFIVDGLTREGCPDTDSVTVVVLPPIDYANVITPNGDGFNDTWLIEKIEEYPNAEVNIFNRWGKKLFTSIGYKNPWDGKFNGEVLPAGVYYFVLDLKDGYEPYTGSITILY